MKVYPSSNILFFMSCVISAFTSLTSRASGLLGGYNLGITYESTASHAEISYDTATMRDMPEDCEENTQRPGYIRCTAYLGPDGDKSGSFSVFLEKPFKRQGFFFFDAGFTFSTITYKGGLIPKPSGSIKGTKTVSSTAATSPSDGLAPEPGEAPLTRAYLEFYGINWQTYVRFGITPRYFPDILISLGGGVQTAGGKVRLFKETYTRYVVQPDVFGVAEVVLIRGGSGSMSIYLSQDQSFVSQIGTNLLDDNPSGNDLSNIRLWLSSSAAGLRLLFPF
jgi:hypothetical protein